MILFPKHLTKLELSAVFASILSFVLSIFCLIAELYPKLSTQTLTLFFVIQNAVIIIALILLAGYFIRMAELQAVALEEWKINRYEVPKSIHGFLHEMRDFFSDEHVHNYNPKVSFAQLQKACNSCKKIFDRLTKITNVVTIKMVVDNGESLVTIARDQDGADARTSKNVSQKISDNTAFTHIAIGDLTISQYYINNYLQFDSNYSNTNPNWEKHYTSVITVPIRKGDILVGSLSVDCLLSSNLKSENKSEAIDVYNKLNHVQLLAIFADILYCVISKTIASQTKA